MLQLLTLTANQCVHQLGVDQKLLSTVDREIFTLKIIRVKIFCVVKFSWFCSTREIFLMVDKAAEDFLPFSLLPGIRRAKDRWLYVDLTFIPGSVDLHTQAYSLILTV